MKYIETKHPEEASGLLEEQHHREGFDDVRLNIMDEMHTDDPDDHPPAGTPISVDTNEYHLDGPQPDNVDTVDMRRRSEYLNPYTPFLYEDEFDFALRLVKHGISKLAIDDIMALRTVRSNLPPEHFKSAYTLRKKIRCIDPGGIGDEWVLSMINYHTENSETPYYWRDPVMVVEDLLQNPTYWDDFIYTASRSFRKSGERIYRALHTGNWWWKLQVCD